MSDEMNMPPADGSAPDAGTKKGFLSTPAGRIVAIVVGLSVLAVIAGIAVAAVVYSMGSSVVEEIGQQIQEQASSAPSQAATGTVAAAAPAGPADEVANSEVFTFRDIFVPLLKPLPTSTTTGGDGATPTTDTVTPTTDGVLYLNNIVTEGGVMKGVFSYNGQTYTLGPGERVPGTPWEVRAVSATSVTMRYGDVTVVLSIGQGRAK